MLSYIMKSDLFTILKRTPIGTFHCQYNHKTGYDKKVLEENGWNEKDYTEAIFDYVSFGMKKASNDF